MPFASFQALAAAQARSTGVMFQCLLTIEHPDMATPLRFVSPGKNNVNSLGRLFTAAYFDFVGGSERFDEIDTAMLTLNGIDGTVLALLQTLDPSPSLSVEIIIDSEPDEIQYRKDGFEITNVVQDGVAALMVELSAARIETLPFPGVAMTRTRVPGIFTDL